MDTDTLASFPESTPSKETLKNCFIHSENMTMRFVNSTRFCKDVLALLVSMETFTGLQLMFKSSARSQHLSFQCSLLCLWQDNSLFKQQCDYICTLLYCIILFFYLFCVYNEVTGRKLVCDQFNDIISRAQNDSLVHLCSSRI